MEFLVGGYLRKNALDLLFGCYLLTRPDPGGRCACDGTSPST
jgi:hypothetical protein